MDAQMNALSQANHQADEDIIQFLGLDDYAHTNTEIHGGSRTAFVGFESMQGQQQIVGSSLGGYQPTDTILYVDMSLPGIDNNPYHLMDTSMNALTQVNQEPALSDNDEDVIEMLGLDGYTDSNTGKLVDDMVRNLGVDPFTQFTLTSSGTPASAFGYESMQGHQQLLGNPMGAYQPTEIISYVDLSPPDIENNPYQMF